MAIKNVLKVPAIVPGKGMTAAMHSGLFMVKSDTFSVSDSLPNLLFKVPVNTFIADVILDVQTAFVSGTGGDGTLISGIDDDSDMFFSDTTQCGIGTYSMHGAGALKSGGYLTTGEVEVECSWATGSSVGGGVAYLVFRPFADENSMVSNP